MTISRIGIAGFMGSGKSLAATYLMSRGFAVFDGDAIAKKIMNSSQALQEGLIESFGSSVVNNQLVDFGGLGDRAFKTRASLEKLNSIVHPALKQYLLEFLPQQKGPWVLDAALLPLWEIEELFDCCLWVSAPVKDRLDRIQMRNNLSRDVIQVRMKMQEEIIMEPEGNRWIVLENQSTPDTFYELVRCVLSLTKEF